MPIPVVTRILVADDHAIVRSGLKKVLDAADDLEVIAEAENGAEAVEKGLAEDVHLAILDVSMPGMTGIQAAAELHKRKPELRTLMLSMYDSEQFLFEALKAGASGYVLKSDADQDIVDACRRTMRGQSFLYPSAVATLVRSDPRQDLDRVRCPCLCLWGASDNWVPLKDGMEYARRLRAPLRVIADCGHLLIGERPDAVLDAVRDFLDRVSPAPAG
jgi:DNA-binding NarL/FixJ family response regulator